MAVNLGGGQVIDPSVAIGPRPDLLQARANNIQSQRTEATKTLEMLKTFADAQGLSMSHIAQMFPEQMGFAFDVLNPGQGQQMLDATIKMGANEAQQAAFLNMEAVKENSPYASFHDNSFQQEVPGTEVDLGSTRVGTKNAPQLQQAQMQTTNPMLNGMTVNDMLAQAARVGGQIPQVTAPVQPSEVDFQTPFYPGLNMAQGGSPMDVLAQYGQQTGDVHRPTLVGDQEFVVNKEATQQFKPLLEYLNSMVPNTDAQGIPSVVAGMPSRQGGGTANEDAMAQYARIMASEQAYNDLVARSQAQSREGQQRYSDSTGAMYGAGPNAAQANAGNQQIYNSAMVRQNADNFNTDVTRLKNAAASQADPQEGFMTVPVDFMTNPENQAKYDVVSGMGIVRNDDGTQTITVKAKGPAYSPEAADDGRAYVQTAQEAGAQQLGNQQAASTIPTQGVGSMDDDLRSKSLSPEPVSAPVPPSDEVVVPKPEEGNGDGGEETRSDDQIKYDVYKAGVVKTPAEYETVMRDNGYYARMDANAKRLAEVAPSMAQYIPSAKYYADKAAANMDPMTLAELQVKQSQSTKYLAEAQKALEDGDLAAAKAATEQAGLVWIDKQNQAELDKLRAETHAQWTLGDVHAVDTLIKNGEVDMIPVKLEQMQADLQKTLKENENIISPEQEQTYKSLDNFMGEALKSGNVSRFFFQNREAWESLQNDLKLYGAAGDTTTDNRGWFGRSVEVPGGGIISRTDVDYGEDPSTAAGKYTPEQQKTNVDEATRGL